MENIKINLENLIAFFFVAKERSFSNAATKLFLTQPAVTTKIKCLERQFGTKLFINAGKQLQLTDVGKEILPIAEEVYKKSKEIENILTSYNNAGRGVLRIGASRSLSQTYLPLIINIFSDHYPNIQVSITEGTSHEIIEKIMQFKDNIGIIPKVPINDKITAITISNEKIEFVVSNKNPLAQKEHISIDDMLHQPILVAGEGSATRLALLDVFDKYKVTPNIVFEAENLEMIKKYLLTGKGMALMFPAVVKNELEEGQLKILSMADINIYIDVQLIFLSEHLLSPSAKKVIEIIHSTFSV
ncbi:MAG: LysR family transcriptional regulator [Proteobacteria bacterium]|nr:LysR family transcriptional regulator [Pseudomonadota bacterium]